MRRNLFVGMPNDKLKKCYQSYMRTLCKHEQKVELYSELVTEYKTDAITSLNMGDGVPCTIRFTERDGYIPSCDFVSKIE